MPQTTRNTKRSNGLSQTESSIRLIKKTKIQTLILQYSSNLEAKYKH